MRNWLGLFQLLWALLLLPPSCLKGQSYQVDLRQIIPTDGTLLRQTYHTHQDHTGIIWIATDRGFCSYDGYNFDWMALPSKMAKTNEVHQILEDQQHKLWLISYTFPHKRSEVEQCILYDPAQKSFQTFAEVFAQTDCPKTSEMWSVTANTNGEIYFLSRDAQLFITDGTAAGTSQGKPGHPSFEMVACNLIEHPNPTIPQGYEDPATKLLETGKEYRLKTITCLADGYRLGHKYPSQAKEPQHIYRFQPGGQAEIIHTLHEESVTTDASSIRYQADFDAFWTFDYKNFYLHIPSSQFFYDFKANHPDLTFTNINSVQLDREGSAWISTQQGLYLAKLKESPFRNMRAEAPPHSPKHDTYAVKVLNGQIFSRTNFKVHVYDTNRQALVPYLARPVSGGSPVETSRVFTIGEKQDSLVAFMKDRIRVIDPEKGVFRERAYPLENMPYVFATLNDEEGNLLFTAINKGVFKWNIRTDQIESLLKFSDTDTLVHYPISLHRFGTDNMITGCYNAPQIWSLEDGSYHHLWDQDSLRCSSVLDFYLENDSTAWVTQLHCGLLRWEFDRSGKPDRFSTYNTAHGFASNEVYSIVVDERGQFWIPSNNGLILFDPRTETAQNFFLQDGLASNNFNQNGSTIGADGTFYFSSSEGISYFHPDDLQQDANRITPFLVSRFTQYDPETNTNVDRTLALRESGEIHLASDNQLFTLQVALLTYLRPGNIQYAYLLEGRDNEWHKLNGNQLQLDGLAYGKYTLRIKAEDYSRRYQTQELTFKVFAPAPFYQRWWFILGILLIAIAFTFIAFRYRFHSLRQRQQELEATVESRTATVRKQKEALEEQAAELQQLDELKSRFFANISHELRTPLTLIKGPALEILKFAELDTKIKFFATAIARNSQDLETLVNEILDLSKLEAGKMEVHAEVVDIRVLCGLIVGNFESYSVKDQVELAFFPEVDDLVLRLDTGKCTRILNNLLSNAFKFSPPEGKVSLHLSETTDWINIEVKDTGRGIFPEDLPYVFDRFYQSSRPERKAEGGSGIGLALSREFAQLLGAKLTASSEVGKGSSFVLSLPRSSEVKSPISEAIALPAPLTRSYSPTLPSIDSPIPSGEAKILIVEDNPDLQAYLLNLLQPRYEVELAGNGKLALAKLENRADYDLILSDVMMPEMDGFELLSRLKAHDSWWQIPVVMLTARADLEGKLLALRIGVDDYLRKPFEAEELFARIQNLLEPRRRNGDIALDTPDSSEPTDAGEPKLLLHEQEWLAKLEQLARDQIGNLSYTTDQLADDMAMSKRNLERKLKKLVGLSPHKYIQEIKFAQARTWLEEGKYPSVAMIANRIGFKDRKHFSRLYKARYGRTPASYF